MGNNCVRSSCSVSSDEFLLAVSNSIHGSKSNCEFFLRESEIRSQPPEEVKIYREEEAKRKNSGKKQKILERQATQVLQKKTGNLREHYSLGKKLGNGEFGTTFLCVEKSTGKEYACKSISKRKLPELEDIEDVRREIRIMHRLAGNCNVAAITGVYEDSFTVHMVMELCAGGELFDRIVKKGRYSEKMAAQLARTIVAVVESCHRLGIMHRDLKLENFLFVNEEDDSPLKAIDFGLSTMFKPGETFHDLVGSPYYMAPEVVRRNYGPEADVWSAGVIIYILLCGVLPFWTDKEEEVFPVVLNGEVNFSSDPWPSISDCAKDLVKKMLVKDPKKRLTAREILRHPWLQTD